jgi:DNA-binding transcriptional LysR family regulator
MTFTQLRAFVTVVATGSVRQAAERLFVSQPAVSSSIAALQRELGVPLVSRGGGRGLEITPAGQVFARYARQLLGLAEEAAVATAGHLNPELGQLRVAAVTTAGEHVLPPLLASFRSRYPAVGLILEVGNRARVWELLGERQVDLAIGGRPPANGRFATLAIRPNPLVVVDGPGQSGGGWLKQLANRVWLLREVGSGTRTTTEELFEKFSISPPTLTLGSNGAIRESVQLGLGVTLISRDAVALELERKALTEWSGRGLPLQRQWHVVARSTGELPATTALFLSHVATSGEDESPGRFHLMGEGRTRLRS